MTPTARAAATSATLALAVVVAVSALGGVLAPGPWLAVSALVVAVLAVVTFLVRARTPAGARPTLWGLAVALLGLVTLYGGAGTGPGVPVPATVGRLADLVRDGVQAVADGRIPVDAPRGLELMVVAGAAYAFLVAELLALGLRRPGLAGLPLVALWAVPLVFERRPAWWALALAGTSYLLLLWLVRGTSRGRTPTPEVTRAVAASAALAVGALVVAPLATVLPGWGSVRLPSTWGPVIDGPLRLSTDLDMRASLGERSDRTVLTYTTEAADLGPLRTHTLVDFDGSAWTESPSGDLVPIDGVLWPTPVAAPDPATTVGVVVEVGDLDQDRLPLPVEPRTVAAPGAWQYDPLADEVVSARGASTRGRTYTLEVAGRALTADVLRADRAAAPPADAPELVVPESTFAAEIRATARDVTAQATTPYDQALALQSWFRDLSRFRYETQVPEPETDDAVWDFLESRRGYCVQFATAMTVMARTLGIPARMGVGFLPGVPDTSREDTFLVSGRQAHAWPELWFEGAGWVRFEPTPAIQTGPPPTWANPFAIDPEATATPTPTATRATPTPGASASAGTTSGQGGTTLDDTTVPLWAVGAASVALAGVAAWVLRVRRRRARPEPGPEGAWATLRTRLAELGVTWSDATTPRVAAAGVRTAAQRLDVPAEDAVAALAELVAALEGTRYAATAPQHDDARLASLVERVVEPFDVSRARRGASPSAARGG